MVDGMTQENLTVATAAHESLVRFPVSSRGLAYEVTQLGAGRIWQTRTVAKTANFTAVVGGFNVGLRSRGVFSHDHLSLMLPFGFTERVRFCSNDISAGDIFFCPPGAEHDSAYFGPTSYAGLSLDPVDLAAVLGGEPGLSDPAFWNVRQLMRADPRFGETAQRRLADIMSRLDAAQAELSPSAADFWQRSIVEVFAATVLRALPPIRENPVRSYPRLVRDVERYVDERPLRAVHISEICSKLNVSRRALHRAFDDVLGVGPVAFFRRKRLHAAYTALSQACDDTPSVTNIAMEHGFTELGRFAQAYRSLFGETPSQTLRSAAR